jgi:hypothetical protein
MKTTSLALALVAMLAWSAACRADITGTPFADDGDGVLTCTTYGFHQVAEGEFETSIDGVHHVFETGHILGPILTDTELDPKLTLLHEIDNDTDRAWTDYHAEVTMNKAFTFDNVTIDNSGWTFAITQPVLSGGTWTGTVDYYAGVPVLVGGTIDFGYRMTFIGSASFCEALTPTPEPGTLALLACCGLGLLFVRRRFVA